MMGVYASGEPVEPLKTTRMVETPAPKELVGICHW
jgi:hypothetical protein